MNGDPIKNMPWNHWLSGNHQQDAQNNGGAQVMLFKVKIKFTLKFFKLGPFVS